MLNIFTDYFFWGGLGFFCGSLLIIYNLRKNNMSFPAAVTLVTLSIYAGLLGSRITYVLTIQPRLFLSNFPLAIAFWQGNLSWLGGVISGFSVCSLLLLIIRKPVWSNIGAAAPGIALAHIIARVGCLCQGCCYGAPTDLPWAIYSKQLHTHVHPTQIYDMIGELFSLAILQWLWAKPAYRKYLLPGYGMILGLHRFISEGFRGTPSGAEIIQGLRFYQFVCLAIFIFCAAAFLLLWNRKKGALPAALLVLTLTAAVIFGRPHPVIATAPHSRGSADRYLVLTRKMFVDHLADWKSFREKQGYQIVLGVWDDPVEPQTLRQWVQTNAALGCRYIIIVGDVAPPQTPNAPWHMPTLPTQARFGLDSDHFYSDTALGDLDNDGVPDVPVGRLPVKTTDELHTLIQKILSYDTARFDSKWFRGVIWFGAENFAELMNNAAALIKPQLPRWLETFWVNDVTSPSGDKADADQSQTFLRQFQNPAMLNLIVSHGSRRNVAIGQQNGKPIFLAIEHAQNLKTDRVSGPLFILACQTGQFASTPEDGPSFAQTLLLNAGGPAAVISSTTTVQPLTNYHIVRTLIEKLTGRSTSIGEFWLAVQQHTAKIGVRTFAELSVNDPIAEEFSHLDQMNIWAIPGVLTHESISYECLGDPACRFLIPQPMACSVLNSDRGKMIVSSDNSPQNTDLLIDYPENNASRCLLQKQIPASPWQAEFQLPENYQQNNSYIRILTYNGRQPEYFIYSDKPFGPQKK